MFFILLNFPQFISVLLLCEYTQSTALGPIVSLLKKIFMVLYPIGNKVHTPWTDIWVLEAQAWSDLLLLYCLPGRFQRPLLVVYYIETLHSSFCFFTYVVPLLRLFFLPYQLQLELNFYFSPCLS